MLKIKLSDIKEKAVKLKDYAVDMFKKPDGLGDLYRDNTAVLKHREWRGVKDTAYDYYRWLVTWKDMIVMVGKAPVSTVLPFSHKSFLISRPSR